jgi:hypothetical protein
MLLKGVWLQSRPKAQCQALSWRRQEKINAKIVSVDTQARTVTVEGPMGGKPTIKVGPKVNLNKLQPGDDVTLRVTDALHRVTWQSPISGRRAGH